MGTFRINTAAQGMADHRIMRAKQIIPAPEHT